MEQEKDGVIETLAREFSLKLAERLEEKKVGFDEAGGLIIRFAELVKMSHTTEEIRGFIDAL